MNAIGDPESDEREPKKPGLGGVYVAFSRIAEHLTSDASRIFALFLLLPLTAIVAFIFAPQTPLVAIAILSLVVLSLLVTLYLLWLFNKKQRRAAKKKPSIVSRLIMLTLFGLASGLLVVVLHQVGVLAKAFPAIYTRQAAIESVHRFYASLGAVLAAENDDDRATAIRALANCMTPDFRSRNLPKGCAEVLSKLESKPTDPALLSELKEHAKTYVGWFGLANAAYVDIIGTSSWQRIEKSESRHVLHVLAIVRFSGRFVDNTFPNSKMRVRDLSLALTDPNSRQRLQLTRWLEEQFPSMDRTRFDTLLGQVMVTDLGEANAFDLIEFRVGKDKLGERSESGFRFGNEVSFVSIRLEKDLETDCRWRVAEIGRWGMKRVFTESPPPDSAFSLDRKLLVDGVPYYAQNTAALCQSACLQMTAELLDTQNRTYSQETIRTSLEAIGDPLAHQTRVNWLLKEFPDHSWSMKYPGTVSQTAQLLREQLANGIPVILSTRLTRSGHVIVVTGIWHDASGEVIVRAHDPWGRFNFETLQYERQVGIGRDVEYPLSKLFVRNRKWISVDGKSELAQYVVGMDQWLPSSSELQEKGFGVASTVTDWEFVYGKAPARP